MFILFFFHCIYATTFFFFRHITLVVVVVVVVVFVSMVIGVMMSQVNMNSIEKPIVSLLRCNPSEICLNGQRPDSPPNDLPLPPLLPIPFIYKLNITIASFFFSRNKTKKNKKVHFSKLTLDNVQKNSVRPPFVLGTNLSTHSNCFSLAPLLFQKSRNTMEALRGSLHTFLFPDSIQLICFPFFFWLLPFPQQQHFQRHLVIAIVDCNSKHCERSIYHPRQCRELTCVKVFYKPRGSPWHILKVSLPPYRFSLWIKTEFWSGDRGRCGRCG